MRALVVFELLIQAIGWCFVTVVDPLAGGLVMAVVGALGLAAFVFVVDRGALRLRSLSGYERTIVARLAVGCLIMNVPYVYGAQTLGIGTMMTMTAMGPLFNRFSVLWAERRTRVAQVQMALRLIVIAGVIVVNKPGAEFDGFHKEMVFGIICGLLGAWSFWNYLRCLFGDELPGADKPGIPRKHRLGVIAVADLISLPFIALAVWGGGFLIGGGYAELWSPKVLVLGSIAGLLAFTASTILASIAARKVPEEVSSVLYLLDSTIGSVVGFAGAALGYLAAEQAPSVWGWTGMAVVVVTAYFAAKLPFPKPRGPHKVVLVEER